MSIASISNVDWSQPMRRIKRMLSDSEVVYGLILPAINTVVLIGRTVPGVPSLITDLGYSALRLVGALYLEVEIRSLLKTAGDFAFALATRSWSRVSYTASMLFFQGSTVVFVMGGSIASLAAVCQYGETARWIFYAMRPWALVALVVELLLNVVQHLTDGFLLDSMQAAKANSNRIESFFRAFQMETFSEGLLAAAARSRIDPVTWKELETKAKVILKSGGFRWMRRWRLRRLFYAAIDNIRTQNHVARANLSLTAMGYVARAIVRAYPLTVIEAVVNSTVNAFYTGMMLTKKYIEAGQQEAIEQS